MELSPPDPRVGQVLQGRYKILERLAAGAMGVVYRGERIELGRLVAVKFLHPWIAAQQAFRARFETEARAMSRLSHPNCVSVIDFGVEGAPYLVMDYVTGPTLRKVMEAGPIVPARAVAIVRQLLAGVAHAHAQGIIHRDLKPDNLILANADGLADHVRILDFGLAKLRDGPAMTSGLAIGTPSYMSPEQTGAPGEIDGRTDIYAIGVVLHEMLAGKKPFVSDKVAEILLMHRDSVPTPLRQVRPEANISADLEAAVLRALEKQADNRFQTAGAFAEALERTPEARAPLPAPVVAPASVKAAPTPAISPATVRPIGVRGPIADTDKTIADMPGNVEIAGELTVKQATPSPAPAAPASSPTTTTATDPPPLFPPGPVRWIGLGVVAVLALALVFVGLRRKPAPAGTVAMPPAAKTSAPAPHAEPAAPVAAPPAPTPPSAEERKADAERLLAKGEWEQALVVLQKAHHENPQDAGIAYDLANAALEHKRWVVGAEAARVAGQRDNHFRSDERLVKNLIRGLGSDSGYERTEDVLHGFGAAAVPLLKDAAAHDKNPVVRQRADEILRGRGNNARSSRSAFSRPAPTTSHRSSSSKPIFSR
ncbi:MAG TPA: serine/threonine-protein kinase [Polyangia bacterium]|nr:serine/threonine-protein kinase [Polyangia bacterium]